MLGKLGYVTHIGYIMHLVIFIVVAVYCEECTSLSLSLCVCVLAYVFIE